MAVVVCFEPLFDMLAMAAMETIYADHTHPLDVYITNAAYKLRILFFFLQDIIIELFAGLALCLLDKVEIVVLDLDGFVFIL